MPPSISRKDYFQNGFAFVDFQFPESLLDSVREEFSSHLHKPEARAEYEQPYNKGRRIQDFWRHSSACRKLACFPKVLDALRDLYGRNPFCFQTLNFAAGTEQKIHADSVHFNSIPAGWMCGVWVALEDVDLDSGPLVLYPGSHAWPEWTPFDSGVAPEAPSDVKYRAYEAFVERKLAELRTPKVVADLKKGMAVVWASNLLHGGSEILDPRRSRASQVSHYFFEGCRYYTAIPSDPPAEIHWREAMKNPPPDGGIRYIPVLT